MRILAFLFALLSVVGVANAAFLTHGSVGVGHGIPVPHQNSNPCQGTLCLNYDGSAENGYCWQYGGIVPPYYGAFAECCSYDGAVCGIELMLTGVGYPCGPLDAYVWADAGGIPGNVLNVTSGLNPCPVATWPNISTHDFLIPGNPQVNGAFWIGYWANFSSAPCGYFVAADLNGFGGCPYTNIAPGIGYPTGWQNASVVWGATQALGIGAWLGQPITPVERTSWGRIKQVFN